jgi:ketosteroid isomerase-like protein
VSQENVDIILRALAHFQAEGDFLTDATASEFVWDMSMFHGWPEQQVYEGLEETQRFIRDWTEPFEDWEIEVEAVHDAGDEQVLVILHQHARSRSTGLPVDMTLAQVYTIRDGRQTRMQMYSDPAEARTAAGLEA